MSLENFQLIDKKPYDNSIIKRDFLKVYHQQGANLNDPDQNVEFIFGENNNNHKIGNSYLELDSTVRREDNADFDDDSAIKLVKNAFAFCFKESRLSTTSGQDIEHNKFHGQISTILRSVTSKDGDLLSQFDKINEGETADGIRSTSLKSMLNNNQVVAIKGKIKGHSSLEHVFGFCKTI